MPIRATIWLSLAVGLFACASGSAPPKPQTAADVPSAAAPTADAIGLPNQRVLDTGLIVGGQPDANVMHRARDAGVSTVISLRAVTEPGFDEERSAAGSLGLRFVSIPVAGAEGLTKANAQRLHEQLEQVEPGATIVHCGSGNRAGALLALRAYHFGDASAADALALGKAAGLTGLTEAVAAQLQGPAAGAP